MFTGLTEIHFPAPPLAQPNVNTEDIDRKQTMENMSWRAVALPPPLSNPRQHPSMALLRLSTTLYGDGIL